MHPYSDKAMATLLTTVIVFVRIMADIIAVSILLRTAQA